MKRFDFLGTRSKVESETAGATNTNRLLSTNDVRSIAMPEITANAVAGPVSSSCPNMGQSHQQINAHAQPKWAVALAASHAARKARWAAERAA